MRHRPENSHRWSIISFSPLLLLFPMAPKPPGLTKYTIQKGIIPYQKEISVQYGEILLDISYWTLWMTLKCGLKFLLILYLPIQALIWWLHLIWFLYIEKHNFKRRIGKGYQQQLIKFKHKEIHTFGFFPKSLLIFTTYQVQGCCTMIINTLQVKPDCSNVR